MWGFLAKKIPALIGWGLLLAVISAAVSWFMPWQYSAESQVLLLSRDRFGADPYTELKAAEQVGENLAQLMKTTDFYKKVFESADATFDKAAWAAMSERDRRKHWRKDVQPAMLYGTSLLRVVVFGKNQAEALALSRSVTAVLAARAGEYIGADISVKVVSDPLVSRWPARPNFILNAVLGFLAGVVLSGLWLIAKHRRHHVVFN